jgi:outer membrane protein TolC
MKKFIIIYLAILVQFTSVWGQSLNEYLQTAAENNPELKASFNEYKAALEKVPQVSLPDPELNMGIFIKPMERFMGNQLADVTIMQMFPWFGMLKTRKDEAAKMAMAQYEVFRVARNNLFFQVKSSWYQLVQLEEEVKILEKNLEILQSYENISLIRFKSAGISSGAPAMQGENNTLETRESSGTSMGNMGSMNSTGTSRSQTGSTSSAPMAATGNSMGSASSGMDNVLRVRMEIITLENQLALLRDSRQTYVTEFNQLLNRNYNEEIIITDTLNRMILSKESLSLIDSIRNNHPMLKMIDAEEEAYEAQKNMARLEGKPMIGAGLNYMLFSSRPDNGMAMGGDDMIMPMISLSIPIYRKKYNAMYREAELKQQALGFRRENTFNALVTQWSQTIRDINDAARRTELYDELEGLADQTLNLLLTGYSSDGGNFEEILRLQQQLLNYRIELNKAVVDQHIAAAMLENLAATELIIPKQ